MTIFKLLTYVEPSDYLR